MIKSHEWPKFLKTSTKLGYKKQKIDRKFNVENKWKLTGNMKIIIENHKKFYKNEWKLTESMRKIIKNYSKVGNNLIKMDKSAKNWS